MATVDKRRRNARRSKYRPRSEAQKQRRKELWAAREADRKAGRRLSEEDALTLRLEELEAALRDQGHVGIHNRRHVTPLDEIEDDVQRFAVLKARVERLEALWAINQRKRETRGKIIIGGALLAEAADFDVEDRDALLERLVDILDRRVDRVRDRLTVRELLGDAPLPLRPGGDLDEDAETALAAAGEVLPDFDAMAQAALADDEDDGLSPGEIDPDYADLDGVWEAPS
ncbi:hypothetical protein [Phenylobacterium sp. SCN 70-31]|uniref:hypothetical protein n=1 Tax=Phenylobacterium sp. SCN 70-31 TaxID=1660129 RepID=UPI0008687055|nr:hypothetical protein [Phenylobacterium sp. SCN 70-31]ODT85007.1 MAG: hypothetical protein ABS78_21705 [Phenylobacterium sp. SCN 70-31]